MSLFLRCVLGHTRSCFQKASKADLSRHASSVQHSVKLSSAIGQDTGNGRQSDSHPKRVRRKKSGTGPATPKPPLEKTRVEEYLDFIASTKDSVVLADIERYKPSRHSPPGTDDYERDYTSLLNTLMASFGVRQLRAFATLYGIPHLKMGRKQDLAMCIIERQWGWPSLNEIHREKRLRTEIIKTSLPLDPRQSFLILGKDGANLRALSAAHHVQLSFSRNPLSLEIHGRRGSVEGITRHISDLRQNIQEQIVQLPAGATVNQDTLRRVSRMTGVFTESLDGGRTRISFRESESRAANLARRILTLAAYEVPDDALHLFGHSKIVPASHESYSLYPFSPTSTPYWVANSEGYFRLRRVGKAISSSSDKSRRSTDPLDFRESIINMNAEHIDFPNLLNELAPVKEGITRSIAACFGHIVFGLPTPRPMIIPPLQGEMSFDSISHWQQAHEAKKRFIPSPSGLHVKSHSMLSHHQTCQLEYRLASEQSSDNSSKSQSDGVPEVLKLEIPLLRENSQKQDNDYPSPSDRISPSPPHVLECFAGSEIALDILLPQRPIDIRFLIFNGSLLRYEQLPLILQEYIQETRKLRMSESDTAVLEAPLTCVYNGHIYALQRSSLVRRRLYPPDEGTGLGLKSMCECVTDLDRKTKYTTSKVTIYMDAASENMWSSFWATCDSLAGSEYGKLNATEQLISDIEKSLSSNHMSHNIAS